MEVKKLDKSRIQDILALTSMQEGMLFHYLEHPHSPRYFEQLSLVIRGEVSEEVFEKAWNFVIETNEMLRTVFRWEEVENPVQIVLKRHTFQPGYYDIPGKTFNERKTQLEKIKAEDRKERFDLREVPFRVTLCKTGEALYEMIVSHHHILYDGWSNSILLREFFRAYDDLRRQKEPLPPRNKKTGFKAFIRWISSQDTGKQEAFWKEYLMLPAAAGRKPHAVTKPAGRHDDGDTGQPLSLRAAVPESLEKEMAAFARAHRLTLSSLLYAAWGLLLQEYSHTRDLVFDTTVSGRTARIKGIEEMAGLFINTLPLRFMIFPQETMAGALQRFHETLQQRESFENTSQLVVKEYLEPWKKRENLFTSLVVIENYPLDHRLVPGGGSLTIENISYSGMTGYDLTFIITLYEGIRLDFTVKRGLFRAAALEQVSRHFIKLLETIVRTPRQAVFPGGLLPRAEVEAQRRDVLVGRESRVLFAAGDAPPYAPPGDALEQKLAELWIKVLGLESRVTSQPVPGVGIDDNFFHFGGHSLKASLLVSHIHRAFNVKIPLVEVFKRPTIRLTAGYIRQAAQEQYEPIDAAEAADYYELSPSQHRFYALRQLDPASTAYNVASVLEVEGNVTPAVIKMLERAFKELIRRHESLRTSFHMPGGKPVQRVHDKVEFSIEYDHLAAGDTFIRPFDLSRAPLLRVRLVEKEENNHLLILDMHHIVTDGFSMDIFIREFGALCRGEALPAVKKQYKDFSRWQNRRLQSGQLKAHEDYWLGQFPGEVPPPDLVTDFPRPKVRQFRGGRVHFVLEGELRRQFYHLGRETGTTLFMILLAGLEVLLHRYTGHEDIVVGTTTAGRGHTELAGIIGLFIETLALRLFPRGSVSFEDFLQEVKTCTLDAYQHEAYPFRELIKKTGSAVDMSRNPLFNVMLMVQNIDMAEIEVEGLSFRPYPYYSQGAMLDLTFEGVETDEEIRFHIEYAEALYRRETVEGLARHFVNILKNAAAHPSCRVADIPMLGPEEERELLEIFNRSRWAPVSPGYPPAERIEVLFERQAARSPDRIAVVHRDRAFTYRCLNRDVEVLAGIIKTGLKGNYIGLMAEDSPGLFIGLLGILKSGNTFVPLNPVFPEERLGFIIEDCRVSAIAAGRTEIEKARRAAQTAEPVKYLIHLDDLTGDMEDVRGRFPGDGGTAPVTIDQSCYVIYTSGSTGKPRGVPITHRSLFPFFHWFGRYFRLGEHTRVMQTLSYTFDFGVFEILTTFLYGGVIHTVDKKGIGDFSAYSRFINRHGIDTVHVTPVFIYEAAAAGGFMPTLRLVHLGGERLTGKVVKTISRVVPGYCLIYNGYGPTEAVINCTIFELTAEAGKRIDESANISIGRPTARHEIYILDKYRNLLPVGAAGELSISGINGLTEGYLNRPELTAEKFLRGGPGGRRRLYKTGDLARWLADGTIEFIGRLDDQVKVRGFRIEPGEIEARLLDYPGIKDTAVIAREHENGGHYLCAYFTAEGTVNEVDTGKLRRYLSGRLPDYMIPSYFMRLAEMPLAPSGKVHRKALPAPDETVIDTGTAYMAPVTATGKRLVDIWQRLLKAQRIGIYDDFFDLGGDSILVNRCAALIREELGVEIALRKFFERPYIKALVEEIGSRGGRLVSIGKAVRQDRIPLSFAQERLWFLQELDAESAAYFVPRVIRIKGELQKELLERTFTEIIRRHEILRTVFLTDEGRPFQEVRPPYFFEIPVVDWSEMDERQQVEQVETWVSEEGRRAFDFENGPLLRVTLIKLKDREHLLVLTEHHLIHDGWTQAVLLKEFIAIFSAYAEGREHGLAGLPLQYADFVLWQREVLQGEVLKGHLDYWKQKLAGLEPLLEIPADRPRPAVLSGRGALTHFHLSASFTRQLQVLSRHHGVTLFMTMLAALKTLLYRYTGVSDLCVGTAAANRRYNELEGMLGMVINTLPLRTGLSGDIPFSGCLRRVKTTCLEAYEHEDTPFGKIVEAVKPERSLSYTPIFQVMFAFMDIPTREMVLPGLELHLEESHNRSAKFDLNIVVVPPRGSSSPHNETADPPGSPGTEGETLVEWEYNTDIFESGTMERMIRHYMRLLEAAAADTSSPLCKLPMMAGEEIHRLLFEFNDTEAPYPREKSIHRLFAEQAERTPDRMAVIGGERRAESGESVGAQGTVPIPMDCVSITYKELNEKADRLAVGLKEKGVLADSIVGITMPPCIEMIIGIMGILKAGGAYLPIDPEYPQERIDYMLKDSGAKILLSEVSGLSKEPTHLTQLTHPTHLGYVIYTSGSTGRPKGILVEHRNVVRLVKNTHYMTFREGDRLLQTGAISFDASTFEMWGALLNGLTLYPADREEILAAASLGHLLLKYRITAMWLTSSLFNQVSETDPGLFAPLTYLLVGGDVLSPRHINRVRARCAGLTVINGYGPTENTTFSTTYRIEKEFETSIPIGAPITNSTAYIVDSIGNLQPVGVAGELWVGGDGVSRGYLNDPELTAEKFVVYRSYMSYRTCISSKKIYKTGDLARWLVDGNIEFLGRVDQQVKIRGFRVEPAEIESWLLTYPRVKEAVVMAQQDKQGFCFLCAYVVSAVPAGVGEIGIAHIKEYLGRYLPQHMIPAYFVPLAAIPLTPNGKIDRAALPQPRVLGGEKPSSAAPRDELERRLTSIWTEVLFDSRSTVVGIDDNFFELGGHSLNAGVIMARIQRVLGIKPPLAVLFENPTIRELSQYLRRQESGGFTAVFPVEEREYYPLSSAQERLYVLHWADPGSVAYNIPGLFRLEGRIDSRRLETVFRDLIRRHESLRTSIRIAEGHPVQCIHDEVNFEIGYYDMGGTSPGVISRDFIRPFDLSRAPLLRLGLIPSGPGTYYLLTDIHHIVFDGVSEAIFIREVLELYRGDGEQPAPLQIRYRDYALWQKEYVPAEEKKRHRDYWLRQFAGEIPVLHLPLDYPRPAEQSFRGSVLELELSPALTRALGGLAEQRSLTLYMVMLAMFKLLLYKYGGDSDMVVGTAVSGRTQADFLPIVGMFVNTLALRSFPRGTATAAAYLNEIKTLTLQAFENQDYPFEELVDALQVKRDPGRNPLFDVMFAFRSQEETFQKTAIPGPVIQPCELERTTSKFDILLTAVEKQQNLHLVFEYCTALFKSATLQRMAHHLENLMWSVVEDPEREIASLQLLSEAERHCLSYEFNNTAAPYPREKTIYELFRRQAGKTPDKLAAVGREKRSRETVQLTYRELNQESDRLAYLLKEKGVLADSIVGIAAERSMDTIVGILGILKAGGAYLPIDPDYPEDRVRFMLADSNAAVLLTPGNMEFIDPVSSGAENQLSFPSAALAYVIYTSGSTGRPKGVLVEHRSVVRLVKNSNYVTFAESDRLLQTGAISFDASTFEIWGALLNGLTLYLADKEEVLSSALLRQLLRRYRITLMWLTAPLFNHVSEEDPGLFSPLKYLLVGGDALSPRHINRVRDRCPGLRVINGYGPTENTTFSTTYLIREDFEVSIPIGTPIANSTAYIVDCSVNLQPVGVAGELWVGGDGVSRGYLNDPELTNEKFLRGGPGGAVFSKSAPPGRRRQKLYKTGDLARWQADGNIQFLGRVDQQVKIRGFRIELKEIESGLLVHKAVKDAVVLAQGDEAGDKYLCAYVVGGGAGIPSAVELRRHLAKVLPDYMIPSFFVPVEEIPLTPNGKVDRRALPVPGDEGTFTGSQPVFAAAGDEIEQGLADVWSEVLGIAREKINVNADFFDLGGHSLKAAMFIERVYQRLDMKLSLVRVFQTPTIRELARGLRGMVKETFVPLEKAEEREYYPLAAAQRGLFYQQVLNPQSTVYNMPDVLKIRGAVEREKLAAAFLRLIRRHESFRTSFFMKEDEPVQRIHDRVEFEMEQLTAEGMLIHFVRSFNLAGPPLLRVGLLEIESGRSILILDTHHIIFDGVSYGILIRELLAGYEGKEPPVAGVQYKDFALWQNSGSREESRRRQGMYWREKFAGDIPLLELPADFERPPVKTQGGGHLWQPVEPRLSRELRELAGRFDVTLFVVFLSAYYILLSGYSRQDDIVVGVPVSGRRHPDLQALIGMFVNMLALRAGPCGEKRFNEFLLEVKTVVIEAMENQDYSFDELVSGLGLAVDPGRNPLFDAALGMHHGGGGGLKKEMLKDVKGLEIEPFEFENHVSRFDLFINVIEIDGDTLKLTVEYSTELFKPAAAAAMLADYLDILAGVVKDEEIMLQDLVMSHGQEEGLRFEKKRKRRQAGRRASMDAAYAVPGDVVEEKLARIWAEVLFKGGKPVSIDADFFAMGGHSLKMAALAAKVLKVFGVTLSLKDIFRDRTVRQMAGFLKAAKKTQYTFIDPVEEKEYYPLSSSQKRLYILQQLESGTVYNMPMAVELAGSPDVAGLERVFQGLIRRHEMFRTSFEMIGGEPVQRIRDKVEFSMRYYDLAQMNEFVRIFDLAEAPLIRVGLVKIDQGKYILMMDMHHIISDGVSQGILIKDFMVLSIGEEPFLPVRYRDYAAWQRQEKEGEKFKSQAAYWLREWEGDVPVLELPLDYPRPAEQSFAGLTCGFALDEPVTAALKQVCREQGVTLYMLLLALFDVFLSRIAGSEEVVVGTPVAGRSHPDLESIIGVFINTLALKSYPAGEKTFTAFLREVKKKSLEAFDNQDYPFEDLVEQLRLNRDAGRSPLFDVMFSMQNLDIGELEIPGLRLTPVGFENKNAKFDLSMNAVEKGEGILLSLEYCTRLFKEETMLRLARYFTAVVSGVIQNPGQEIRKIEILTNQEKDTLLYGFNNTAAAFPAEKTLHRLFEEQVERAPDSAAVVGMGSVRLTYKELNRKSDRSAYVLKERGVLADSIVGITAHRSIDTITGILGILKAGGAYLPIAPDYPQERIDYMLKDSNAVILLSRRELSDICRGTACRALTISPATCNLHLSLAYVMYTSGTTGRPKGVPVEHRSVVNLVCWFGSTYGIGPGVQVLQMTDYTFDASVEDIFGTLVHGGSLHVGSRELVWDRGRFRDYAAVHGIHLVNFVPGLLAEFLGEGEPLTGLQTVITGGERLTPAARDRIMEKEYCLFNNYGPTEITVDALSWRCTAEPVSLGYPIANTGCFILDRHGGLVPVGVFGELCVGGAGAARGYLNQVELTAGKFVDYRSYRSYRTYIPKKIYKTGDLARWQADGRIEFGGRLDHQVKVRGYRVEPGEIENCLLGHGDILEAVVELPESVGGSAAALCAYIVCREPGAPGPAALKAYLSGRLPHYMVPAHFVHMEKIPLTATGKVDRRKLPSPRETQPGAYTPFQSPGTVVEELIARIWQETLGLENVGIHDNFFDLGGTSLDLIKISARMKEVVGGDFSAVTLFRYPTINSIAQVVYPEGEDGFTRGKRKIFAAIDKARQGRQQQKTRRKRITK